MMVRNIKQQFMHLEVLLVLPSIYKNLSLYLKRTEQDEMLTKCNHSIFLAKLHQANRWYTLAVEKENYAYTMLHCRHIKQNKIQICFWK